MGARLKFGLRREGVNLGLQSSQKSCSRANTCENGEIQIKFLS